VQPVRIGQSALHYRETRAPVGSLILHLRQVHALQLLGESVHRLIGRHAPTFDIRLGLDQALPDRSRFIRLCL
jgi:hypothetical protein